MLRKLNLILGILCLSFAAFSQQNDWKKYSQMGKRFYEKGEYESAYQALLKARELAPAEFNMDDFLAQAAYRAGKYQEAAEAYKRSTENKADTWSNYNKGNAHFKNQELDQAIQSYKEALRKDPSNEVARHNLAQALKKQQNENQQNQDNQDKNQDKQNQNQNQDKQQDKNDKQDKNDNQDKNDKQDQKDQQEQPKMGKEQTDQLLESMMQADKKAQDKLKDKEKGVGSGKREKDW